MEDGHQSGARRQGVAREVVDIRELNQRIAEIVEHENALRQEIDQIVAELEAEEDWK